MAFRQYSGEFEMSAVVNEVHFAKGMAIFRHWQAA